LATSAVDAQRLLIHKPNWELPVHLIIFISCVPWRQQPWKRRGGWWGVWLCTIVHHKPQKYLEKVSSSEKGEGHEYGKKVLQCWDENDHNGDEE
jgi:hypothetical protein